MNVFYRYRFISLSNINQEILLPVVQIDNSILESFLRYQIKFKNRGKTWHKDSALSMVLLLEFYFATEGDYANPKQMFEAFADAVRYGTVNLDQSDETGLRWEPKSPERSNTLIHRLTAYSNWLYLDTDNESALLNPLRDATKAERITNLAAYHHMKNNSFLKHTYDDAKAEIKAGKSRTIIKHKVPKKTDYVEYKFPKERFWDLIDTGFIKYGSRSGDPIYKRLNLTSVLITLLLRYTGIRASEAFHIYLFEDDITVDPMSPRDEPRVLIRIHHPADGLAPLSWRKKYNKPTATRTEYLKIQFGMLPRNDTASPKALYVGWKDPVLLPDKKFMIANFYDFQAARLFLIYWRLYLKQMPKNKTHPFAFSNKDGDPLSYKAFGDSYQLAIEKIGLTHIKSEGTTKHGLRHLNKAEITRMGMPGHLVSHLLHHANLESKNAYGKITQEEINKSLSDGQDKLSEKFSVPASLLLEDES